MLIDKRVRAAGFHGGDHLGDLARPVTLLRRHMRPYTLAGDAARTIASSLSSNSNPAVRGLWLRVYQR